MVKSRNREYHRELISYNKSLINESMDDIRKVRMEIFGDDTEIKKPLLSNRSSTRSLKLIKKK